MAISLLALAACGVFAPFASAQEYRSVSFSRAPEDRTDTVVGPDANPTILRTAAQVQNFQIRSDDDTDFVIRTDLPGPERLFDTRKSEAMMREYIRRDTTVRTGPGRTLFPDYPPLTKEVYVGRHFARSTTVVEPDYVCHGRLYFEQPNFERHGWDFGPITPGLNLGVYYYDLFMLPYHAWTNPCVCYDCNTGKCSPGDPTPFYLYREQFSVSGLAAQTLAVGGVLFFFP